VAHQVLVVGGGHNGLVAACYLARAGVRVQVLEQSDRLGGGSRTEELIPGFRFNTHSAAHNILNATDIAGELHLHEVGLRYREMDPFSVAVFSDGRIVRFHRSVEATVDSLAEVDRAEADRYAAWMREAMPVVSAARWGLEAGAGHRRRLRTAPRVTWGAAQALVRGGGPAGLGRTLLLPYGRMLRERFATDLVRAPVSAFAAHASASPEAPGGAMFALWQAFYHQVGQWHAVGGSGALVTALTARLEQLGGSWRVNAPVARITRAGRAETDPVTGVELESGERLHADSVLSAVDPAVALLDLLDPPLGGEPARQLRAVSRSNAVQMVVHLAVNQLPAYPTARPGDWNGLQSYVDTLDDLADGFAQAQARRLPQGRVPTYSFTPSALEDSLAPAGQHTVYLACPCAPAVLEGGWEQAAEGFADRMVATVEARAPDFTASVVGRSVRTPELMQRELRWPGAHPMYLDLGLHQSGPLRPTPALARHLTPVPGMVISGAGTHPVGGIAGTPGRAAARALLHQVSR